MTILDLLEQNRLIYGVPDDRLYTVEDLLHNLQKFILEYLSVPDQNNLKQIANLNVVFAWFLALINRYHINIEQVTWHRYAYKCPFCLEIPCDCQNDKSKISQKTGRPPSGEPKSLKDWQIMLGKIYPDTSRKSLQNSLISQSQALNYQVRLFFREKRKSQFKNVETEAADFIVLLIRLYNTYNSDIAQTMSKYFQNGCYVCHTTPCECNYFQ